MFLILNIFIVFITIKYFNFIFLFLYYIFYIITIHYYYAWNEYYHSHIFQNCVIDKAVRSVVAIKNISKDEATEAVMRVFDKCYNDLEPVGRRLRRNSLDMEKAYYEGTYYGYSD